MAISVIYLERMSQTLLILKVCMLFSYPEGWGNTIRRYRSLRAESPPHPSQPQKAPLHLSMSQESDTPRRAYGYCFTLNNYTAEDELHLQGLRGVQYLIYGREVGDSGTPHLQGYIHYINNKSFQSVKNDIPRAHVERRQGTVDQAVEYCRKDSDVYEKGKSQEVSVKRRDVEACLDRNRLSSRIRKS